MTDIRDAERPPLQLWAGLEPTVNRVRDRQMDQLALSGTDRRPDDMDRLADLGVRAVRFPLLWERTAPRGLADADWRWGDSRLRRLQVRRVQPIVGLVHHGSGPRGTGLLEPSFVSGLVAYARAVAQRYPEITAYTPVNEPLTTARFSALYGHWYPHERSEHHCWTALKHQLMATVLAMRAISEVQPAAQLIQTEDLGRAFSTPDLASQADFENERRWLTFDLLCGRLHPDHPLWAHLRSAGATERDLLWFAEHPCPPDILGLNVYVTGERFLDSRTERYPPHTHGGNGHQRYADVEAVRVCGAPHGGPAARLAEAHARYGLPLALTEVQLHCTREEQVRWLWQSWTAAQAARQRGVDVRAVTAWAAMGAFDWNSLLTRQDGQYESGVWDLRAPQPRPTALAHLARCLSSGRPPSPLASGAGWWARPVRHLYPVEGPPEHDPPGGPDLLLVGPPGTLRRALLSACALRGLPVRTTSAAPTSLTREPQRPWAVVQLSGPDGGHTARACAAAHVPLLTFSSADVFNGPAGSVWTEQHAPTPLTGRARRQWAQDQTVLATCPLALIVRTGPVHGQTAAPGPVARPRQRRDPQTRILVPRTWITPVTAHELINTALDLLIDGESGVWHLSSRPPVLSSDWARELGAVPGLPAVGGSQFRRDQSQALGSVRGWPLCSASSAHGDTGVTAAPGIPVSAS